MAGKTPESDKTGKEADFKEKWWEKWIELFEHLIGVKDLEKTVTALANEKDAQKVKGALLGLQGEEKAQEKDTFVRKLTNLLLHKEDPGKQAEIDTLLDVALETKKDAKAKTTRERFSKTLKDPKVDAKEFEEAGKEVKARKDEALDEKAKKLTEVKLDDDDELKALRAEIDVEVVAPRELSEAEKEKALDDFWVKTEEDLIYDEKTQKRKNPSFVDSSRRVITQHAKKVFDRVSSSTNKVKLTKEESDFLNAFLLKHLDDDGSNLIMEVMEKKLEEEDFLKLTFSVVNSLDNDNSVSNRGGNRQEQGGDVGRLVDLLTGRQKKGSKSPDQFNENDWEELRVSGLLNIDKDRYPELNESIKKELGFDVNPLVVDKDRKTARVNEKLTKDQKDKVNKYFRVRLTAEVRMMVDESVQITQSNADSRATEYATIMSIMGLSTSMKSDVMNSARRMTFAFMVFNTPQTEEGYRQLCEYAAQIGSEYSVFKNVMMMREKISVKLEGKEEVELTDLSQIDLVNIASQAIIDPEDRKHYGITKSTSEVGRTYADMMMASTLREQKLDDWIPVTRKALKERLGEDGYKEMLLRIKAVDASGNPLYASEEDTANGLTMESKYLRAVGDKYWDYYNGIYTYYLMTRSSGEFVANANPDNSGIKLPSGLNENFNFKMDPSAWATFQDTYNVPNFPEIIELFRRNGNSSMTAKEGNEVLSYLVQTKRDGASKLPTIADGWYKTGHAPDEKRLAKFSAVIVGSIFMPDQYHLGQPSQDVLGSSHIYDSIPLKYNKDGVLKLDATAQRRDFAAARIKMREGFINLHKDDPSIFENMDFSFIKDKFAHDEVLVKNIDKATTGLDKALAFADRWGEDKQLFDNLSNKRPDDFTKYAIDYHKEWQSAASALAAKPTWATYIKMMGVVQRIVGAGEKIEPLAMRGFELMVQLRKARVYGEKYVKPVELHEGGLSYKDGNYFGELAGRNLVPDLEQRRVTWKDYQENGGKPPSLVTMAGGKGEVDEEGAEQQMLGAMKMASLLTEHTYKHERKHLAKNLFWWHWNKDRPFVAELWDSVTGKKIVNYLAIEVFDMPPEYFLEMVIGGTGDFVSMWWKYFNGTGAGGHH